MRRASIERATQVLGGIGAEAARMIDVVMGKHEIAERLARIFLLGQVHDDFRLPVVARCIEGDEIFVGRDDQGVVGAAGGKADIGRHVGERNAVAVVRVQRFGVEIEARRQPPHDPLIRHLADGGGARRLAANGDGRGERVGRQRRVEAVLLQIGRAHG